MQMLKSRLLSSKYALFIVILGIINIKIIYLSWRAQFYVIFLLATFRLINSTARANTINIKNVFVLVK